MNEDDGGDECVHLEYGSGGVVHRWCDRKLLHHADACVHWSQVCGNDVPCKKITRFNNQLFFIISILKQFILWTQTNPTNGGSGLLRKVEEELDNPGRTWRWLLNGWWWCWWCPITGETAPNPAWGCGGPLPTCVVVTEVVEWLRNELGHKNGNAWAPPPDARSKQVLTPKKLCKLIF